MKHSILLIFLLIPVNSFANEYLLTLKRVKDGDTIVADINMDFDITLRNKQIRFEGFDAWESSYRRRTVNITPEEIIKGKKATKDLEQLLRRAQSIVFVPSTNKDPYGRVLGKIYVWKFMNQESTTRKISVNEYMHSKGHSRQ